MGHRFPIFDNVSKNMSEKHSERISIFFYTLHRVRVGMRHIAFILDWSEYS